MQLLSGAPLDAIREAGKEPVTVWLTPFGYAVEIGGRWGLIDPNREPRNLSEHPDVASEGSF